MIGARSGVGGKLYTIGQGAALLVKLGQGYAAEGAGRLAQTQQQGTAGTQGLARLTFQSERLAGLQIQQAQRRGAVLEQKARSQHLTIGNAGQLGQL